MHAGVGLWPTGTAHRVLTPDAFHHVRVGGLVAGPEPSKLMARVQIPADAFCEVLANSVSEGQET